jgi:ABC-type transporter MlaC component
MTMYEELEHQFRKFLLENYGDKIEQYVRKQTNYVSVEKMMDLILSSITVTFSIKDKNDERINMEQYFDSLKYLINEVKDKS